VSSDNQAKYQAANYEELCKDTIFYGSSKTVIEKIQQMKEATGANSLILHFPPQNTREQNKRVLRRFAEEVIPKFRKPSEGASQGLSVTTEGVVARV
jgi:alkanesulfonate monooxygenase SsuD/methylene tetrahydromethanopterin reductase-like flavin-dependent oxidoreductase (luciferase family)